MKKENNKLVLSSILLTIMVDFLGYGLVIPVLASVFLNRQTGILPDIYTEQTRLELLGLVIAAYPLGQFFGSPFFGTLSDKIGRKKVLLASLVGTFIGYILFAVGILFKFLPLLVISRLVDGFTGGNVSTAYSAVSDLSNPKNKTKNFGLVGAALGLGLVIGPIIGGKLSDNLINPNFTFATPFWFAALLSLANILFVSLFFKETLKNKNSNAHLSLFAGFRNIRKAFKIKDLGLLYLVVFFFSFGFIAFTQFFQVYLIEKFKYDQSQIGNLFAYIGLWIVITQGILTKIISKKYSPTNILKISLLALAVCIPMLLLPQSRHLLYFVTPLIAISQGLSQPSITTLISNSAPQNEQGEILGINQSIQSITFIFPPITAGILSTYDIKAPLLMSGLFIFISWIIYLNESKTRIRKSFF